MLQTSDYTHRIAYLVSSPNPQQLEHFESIEEDIEACKKGLIWLGFQQSEISEYDDDNDLDISKEYLRIKQITQQDSTARVLVYIFYKGHANVMNGLLSVFGEYGESLGLENFARDCATISNVKVIGLYDTCRRDRGQGGIYTSLEETKDIVSIYREPPHSFIKRQCPCEPHALPNMAEDFFNQLKEKVAEREG